MSLSPRTLASICVAITLAVVASALTLALQVPVTGVSLAAPEDGSGGLLVIDTDDHASPGLAPGDRITAFLAGDERIPATPALLVEDPDAIVTFDEYNTFMTWQTRLATALGAGMLAVETGDGRKLPLSARQRHLGDLPLMFWLQVLFGVGGMLTGALVLAARPADTATRLYALTGLGFLIFAPAAAVYSTRELVLSGELFRPLSLANHFGALLFTASLTALVWRYPTSLRGLPVVALCYIAAFSAWVADIMQAGDSNTLSPTSVLLIFLLSFLFAAMQWWRTRQAPADRAALRWFLLSIYIATGLFAGAILVPTAIGVPAPASQGVMFGAFLIMYWGLALGITRYRLFQLERWWRDIWWWFVGGTAIVVVDIVLISTLALSDAMALSMSVAIVGWLYFPLRQWLWSRTSAPRSRPLAQWLPDVLPMLIETASGSAHEEHIRECWPAVVGAVFRPLAIEPGTGSPGAPAIRENGLALAIPDARDPTRHLLLRYPDAGSRLFTHDDLDTLSALLELFDLALDRLRARDTGARLERERIRRDIHDDLGARLLTLLHRSAPENQPLVREAIDDLRILVRALDFEDQPLREALDIWQAEARKRVESAGATLDWQGNDVPASVRLTARQSSNIMRIVREGISNALRHARPASILIRVNATSERLVIEIHNDGLVKPLADWADSRGRQITQGRAADLGGTAIWHTDTGGATLRVEIPLS